MYTVNLFIKHFKKIEKFDLLMYLYPPFRENKGKPIFWANPYFLSSRPFLQVSG